MSSPYPVPWPNRSARCGIGVPLPSPVKAGGHSCQEWEEITCTTLVALEAGLPARGWSAGTLLLAPDEIALNMLTKVFRGATMRKILRDHSLSLAMFGLFVLFLVGFSGLLQLQRRSARPPASSASYPAYLTSGHFWATVFENWESEFLQMAAYVVFTVFLFQRGSAESKDPDAVDEVDEDPRHHQYHPQARDRCAGEG